MSEPEQVTVVKWKRGENPLAGVECHSPVTNAGILQHQHQHLVEENQRLTARVKELELGLSRLGAELTLALSKIKAVIDG